MNFRRAYVLLLMALVGSCSAIDRNAFTFTHYKLDVRVEPEQQRLAVRGRITLRNDSSVPQKNAALQISSSLDWRSIQIDGKTVQFVSQPYTSDIDHTGAVSEAIVSLPAAIAPKANVNIDVGYEGVIPLDSARLKRIGVPDEVAKHSDWDQISPTVTAVRGVGYVVWYPAAMDAVNLSAGNSAFESIGYWKARERDAEIDVDLCVVSDQSVPTALMNDYPARNAGNGSADQSTGGCTAHTFAPLGLEAPAFLVGDYQTADTSSARIFYLRGHDDGAKSYATAVQRVSPLIAQWLGQPRGSQKIVELGDPEAAPFETGSVLLTAFNYDQKLAELSVAHAVAHAAFPSPRPWIYEGVAHFAQALWREHESGRQAALDFMGLHRTALSGSEERHSDKAEDRSLVSTADEELYRSKANFLFWMLRDMLGERVLKNALAAYRVADDHDPAYMPGLIQAQTTRDLQWFFDDWVYHDRGLPDFRVASVYASKTEKGIYLVTVTIENLGEAGAEVPFTVRFGGGEVTKRLEVRAKKQATIRVETPGVPTQVVVNDSSVPESNMGNNVFRVGGGA